MASPTEIRRAISALLDSLDGVDVQVAPAAVEYGARELHQAFAVRILTGPAGDEAAELLLDELIAPDGGRSVKRLVETDPTLGGLVTDTTVTRCTGWQLFPRGDMAAVGATWTVSTLS